jgi:hypothetical protein
MLPQFGSPHEEVKTADKKKKEATNPTWKSSVKAVPRTVFLMVGKDDVF